MVSHHWPYLLLLLLIGAERLVELRLSKRNLEKLRERGAVEVGQRHFVVMVVLHTAFLFACAAEVFLFDRAFHPWIGVPALVVTALAMGLRYWAVTTLGERWNTRVVVLPSAEPVQGGPYRFVRHPNYVAVVAEILALPLVHGAWLTALVFTVANAVLLTVRIRVEEQALGERWATAFGDRPRFVPEDLGDEKLEAEVMAVISRILATETEVTKQVTPDAHLLRDLEMDSLSLTVLAVGLEDEYRIKLTEEDTSGIETVKDLAALVVRRVSEVAR